MRGSWWRHDVWCQKCLDQVRRGNLMAECPSCRTFNFDRFTSCAKCGGSLEAYLDVPLLSVGGLYYGQLTLYPDRVEWEKQNSSGIGRSFKNARYEDIAQVGVHKGLLNATLWIATKAGTTIETKARNDNADAAYEELDRRRRAAVKPPTMPAPPAAADIPEQIASLAKLRDAKILTEEEFQIKKSESLKRL
jgi:hypothetical protein